MYLRSVYSVSLGGETELYGNYNMTKEAHRKACVQLIESWIPAIEKKDFRGYILIDTKLDVEAGEFSSAVVEKRINPPPNVVELNVEAKPKEKVKKVKKVNVAFVQMHDALNQLAAQ